MPEQEVSVGDFWYIALMGAQFFIFIVGRTETVGLYFACILLHWLRSIKKKKGEG